MEIPTQPPILYGLRESFVNHTDFSSSLAKHVFSDKHTNFVLSPLSIHVALSLLAAGSNGPTRDQLLSFIRFDSVEEVNSLYSQVVDLVIVDDEPLGGPRLSLANGVWLDRNLTLKPAFRDIVHNVYKAACSPVDFLKKTEEVREEVNRWVDKETNGLIKNILGPGSIDPHLTRLIFTNAVYFKGLWKKTFQEHRTEDRKFFLSNGTSIRAPFMTDLCTSYHVGVFNGFKVLKLPYEHGKDDERRFSMYIFLPDAKDGLPALLEKMGSEPGFIDKHIPTDKVNIGYFRLPKFKIDSGFEASDVVKGQGVVLPFGKEGGGLTEMVDAPSQIVPILDYPSDGFVSIREYPRDGEDLYASSIMHKALIKVNEQGTEAAAATILRMSGGGCPIMENSIDFVANHPFIFVIREDVCGVVLFIGQLLDPLAG